MPLMLAYAYIMLQCGLSPIWIMSSHAIISLCMLITSLVLICKIKLIPFSVVLVRVFLPIIKVVIIAIVLATIFHFDLSFIDIAAKLIIAILLICLIGMNKEEFTSVVRIISKKKFIW